MINHQSTPTIFLSQNKFNNSIKPFSKMERGGVGTAGGPYENPGGLGTTINMIQD
jgi:hypothetical protein